MARTPESKTLPNPTKVINDLRKLLWPDHTEIRIGANEIRNLIKLMKKQTVGDTDTFIIKFYPTGIGSKITASLYDDRGVVFEDRDITDYDSW